MKKLLILSTLLLAGCFSTKRIISSEGEDGFQLIHPPVQEFNASNLINHPEYPLVANPAQPAWGVFIYILCIILIICFVPIGSFFKNLWGSINTSKINWKFWKKKVDE